MWELIFMVLVLKIPLIYVCWVVWWAIRAEPVIGTEGEPVHEINWRPWRRDPDRPRRRGGPHGSPTRAERRRARTPA